MKIYINTLGCSKNTVDSENAAALLEEAEHSIVGSLEDAELILVNTCGFINDAKEESIDTILEMAEYRKNGAILAASGCLTQRYADELFREIPEIDILLGVNEYERLPSLIEQYRKDGKRIVRAEREAEEYCEIPVRKPEAGIPYAYLKISEGCDRVCSYCIIPSIRGHYRSRKMENIVREAEFLASCGCSEIILIAQNVTAYGTDLYGRHMLAELLRQLCAVEKIHWIRLLYCYEDEITEELIETIRSEEKICDYIDIPLQHVDDRILADMNRNSTSASIRSTVSRLREAIPDIHIRTTFITGFPGESEEAFGRLASFVEETRFDRMGVFSYSQEENTIAGERKDQIPQEIRDSRRDLLMEIQRGISLENNLKKVGQIFEVMVEEQEEENTYLGRTRWDAPEIDDGVIFTSERVLRPGEYVFVEVTDAFDYDLCGRIIENTGEKSADESMRPAAGGPRQEQVKTEKEGE